jgi:hypothetical protein
MASATSSSQRDWGKVRQVLSLATFPPPHQALTHRLSVPTWSGHGVCGPHEGMHHRPVQPLWPHPRGPCGYHVAVPGPGKCGRPCSHEPLFGLRCLALHLLGSQGSDRTPPGTLSDQERRGDRLEAWLCDHVSPGQEICPESCWSAHHSGFDLCSRTASQGGQQLEWTLGPVVTSHIAPAPRLL